MATKRKQMHQAGYDYRTPYGNFQVCGGNLIHAFSYDGKPCGATTIVSLKEIPQGDKANAIYAIVHRANAYPKLVEALRRFGNCGLIQTDGKSMASAEPHAELIGNLDDAYALLRELGEGGL